MNHQKSDNATPAERLPISQPVPPLFGLAEEDTDSDEDCDVILNIVNERFERNGVKIF